jgi:hypothetical protein
MNSFWVIAFKTYPVKPFYINNILSVFACLAFGLRLQAQVVNPPQLGKNSVTDVIGTMTLEEKIDLVAGEGMYIPGSFLGTVKGAPSEAQKRVVGASGTTKSIPRLGIPSIIICDGHAGEGSDRKVKDDYNLSRQELDLIKSVSDAFHEKQKGSSGIEYRRSNS